MAQSQDDYEERSNCYHRGNLAWQVLEISSRNIKQVQPIYAILDFQLAKLKFVKVIGEEGSEELL